MKVEELNISGKNSCACFKSLVPVEPNYVRISLKVLDSGKIANFSDLFMEHGYYFAIQLCLGSSVIMHTGNKTSEVWIAQQGPSDGSVVKSAKLNSHENCPLTWA